MILLSRIFKSYQTASSRPEKKVITVKPIRQLFSDNDGEEMQISHEQIEKLLLDAEEEANQRMAAAENDAEMIRQQIMKEKHAWNEEKQQLMEEAHNVGYNAGFSKGKEQGYAEMRESIHFAQNVIETAKRDYESKIVSAEGTILQIAIKVAEKILGTTLEKDEQLFSSIVKTVLKEVREDREVQIHVHPTYYEMILSQKDELLNVFPAETALYIYPNEELLETNCYIESENGRVDASIDSQLAEIKQKLFELLESEK